MKHLSAILIAALLPLPMLHASTRFILVGDSTVAERSGWGPAFCASVAPGVTCINMAKGGRSSKSYRADGSWQEVLDTLKHHEAGQSTYVLLQFGHNDQPGKPGRSTDVATEFPANMKAYVDEIKSAGATPILVTPLARRQWDSTGNLRDTLQPWADADKSVASAEHVTLLDLHADSMAALKAMGRAEGDTLAMAPPPVAGAPVPTVSTERAGEAAPHFDGTHLGSKGAAVFAAIIVKELNNALPDLGSSFKPTTTK